MRDKDFRDNRRDNMVLLSLPLFMALLPLSVVMALLSLIGLTRKTS